MSSCGFAVTTNHAPSNQVQYLIPVPVIIVSDEADQVSTPNHFTQILNILVYILHRTNLSSVFLGNMNLLTLASSNSKLQCIFTNNKKIGNVQPGLKLL